MQRNDHRQVGRDQQGKSATCIALRYLILFFSQWGIGSSLAGEQFSISMDSFYSRGEDRLEVQRLGRKLSIASIQAKDN